MADPVYGFDESSRPDRSAEAFARLLSGAPIKSERRDRLDYMSGGSIADGLPRDRVALVAEAEIDLPPGGYTLRTISEQYVMVPRGDEKKS